MRCKPLSLLALVGAVVVALAACTPPAAPTPTAVAPTSLPKSEVVPAKPVSAPAKPTAEAAPAQAAAASAATDSRQALADAKAKYYEAAKQEGKLVFYGTSLSPALLDPLKEAFGKLFPGIDIQGEEQTGNITREKIIAEQVSKNYVADVVFSGFSTTRDLIDAGSVVPYESPQVPALIPEFVLPGGLVNPRSASLVSVAINTNLVPPDQEPKVWNDVLDPKWKGKLATQDPRQPGGGGSIISGMAMVYGFEWLEKLRTQEPFFGPGEYAIFLSANHADAVVQRKAGAPIKFLKLQDGAAWTYTSMLNIKNQPHPNAARLFIEWVLSEDGQLVLSAQGFGAVRKGIKAVEPEANMDGVVFLPRDNTPEADALIGTDQERAVRWHALLFK
jgi:iron(III) transport system substrate-binding protein